MRGASPRRHSGGPKLLVGGSLTEATSAGGGIASVRHDELVRRHVEEHGSISRREAAELCALTAPQAYRLLKKMESDGILRRVGTTGRGARHNGNA